MLRCRPPTSPPPPPPPRPSTTHYHPHPVGPPSLLLIAYQAIPYHGFRHNSLPPSLTLSPPSFPRDATAPPPPPVLLTVPLGTPAVYFNLSSLASSPSYSNDAKVEWVGASHDSPTIVQNAVLLRKHRVLVLLLLHDLASDSIRQTAHGNVTVPHHATLKKERKGGEGGWTLFLSNIDNTQS